MALILRGNVWYVKLEVGGKPVVKSTGCRDRTQAEAFQEALRATLRGELAATPVQPRDEAPAAHAAVLEASSHQDIPAFRSAARAHSKRLKDAINRYADLKAGNKTLDESLRILAWWEKKLGNPTLDRLDPERIRTLAAQVAKTRSGATANRYLAAIRAVLGIAAECGWMPGVPRLRKYQESRGVERYLSEDEIVKLLKALSPRWRDIAIFALATGLRAGAIFGLTWDRVNMERKFCWIDSATSKSGKPIHVPLNDAAMGVLERRAGKHYRLVFSSREGKQLKEMNSNVWRRAIAKAGIAHCRFHDLRHTWASIHAMNGTPMHVLQALGGWHDAGMVRRYAHLSPDSLHKFVDNAPIR